MIRHYLPRDVRELAHWYERYVSPFALIAGFIADNLYLTRRVDLWQTNALLGSYLIIAAIGIALVNMLETGRIRHPRMLALAPLIPVVIQFAFGGLFSGFLSLYGRSASMVVSWIFVVALAALLIGNERFIRWYVRFSFQIGMYFAVLFSFLIFFLPVIFRQVGPWMFLGSGAASMVVIAAFLALLARLVPGLSRQEWRRAFFSVLGVYVFIHGLYFSGAIPPLPLSLKEAGVYHSVARQPDGSYLLLAERRLWLEELMRRNTTIHQAAGEPVYAWSVVFAPSGLKTAIEHEWQRFDEETGRWETTDMFTFPVTGGRDGGFRGYTLKTAVSPGRWRVNVVTEHGQVIGRISFSVAEDAAGDPLIPVVR